MAKSASSLAALLMVTAAVAQLMPPTDERNKAVLDRDYSDRESSSKESPYISSYLSQMLEEQSAIPDSDNRKTDEDEAMRRRRVELLMRLLTNYEGNNSPDKKKRTCKVNLGGNCATEEALSMADHWHFLNSAQSPGRRRRRSAGDDRSPLSQRQQRRRFVED